MAENSPSIDITGPAVQDLMIAVSRSHKAHAMVRRTLLAAGQPDTEPMQRDIESAIANLIAALPSETQAKAEANIREALGQGPQAGND